MIFLDLVFTAIRASFLHARFPRLVSLKETGAENVDKAMELVTNRARTRSTLKFSQSLLRFGLAGLVVLYLYSRTRVLTMAFFGLFLLTGFLIWLLEFILERMVCKTLKAGRCG